MTDESLENNGMEAGQFLACDDELTIGRRIRKLRGMHSQQQFSALVNIHKSTLGRYERDECPVASSELEKICKTLSINANWLLLGTGPLKIADNIQPSEATSTTTSPQPSVTSCQSCATLERLLLAEREERKAKDQEIRELVMQVAELKARAKLVES